MYARTRRTGACCGSSRRTDVPGGARRYSPGNPPAQVVEILKARFSRLRVDRIGEVRNALLDTQTRLGSAHIGPPPAGTHGQQGSRFMEVAGREAAHEHVERRLAAAIDLEVPALIVGVAALPGGHDP